MLVDVLTPIAIDRSIAVVAAFATDPDNAPQWYINIQMVEWQTEPPLTLGTKLSFVAHFLGRRLAYTYEVIDFQPGERLTMRTAQGPFPMETTYTWRPEGAERTQMTLRNRGEPSGFGRIAAPLLATAIRRQNRKDLDRLKTILERG